MKRNRLKKNASLIGRKEKRVKTGQGERYKIEEA
jgi:hypothetical protein